MRFDIHFQNREYVSECHFFRLLSLRLWQFDSYRKKKEVTWSSCHFGRHDDKLVGQFFETFFFGVQKKKGNCFCHFSVFFLRPSHLGLFRFPFQHVAPKTNVPLFALTFVLSPFSFFLARRSVWKFQLLVLTFFLIWTFLWHWTFDKHHSCKTKKFRNLLKLYEIVKKKCRLFCAGLWIGPDPAARSRSKQALKETSEFDLSSACGLFQLFSIQLYWRASPRAGSFIVKREKEKRKLKEKHISGKVCPLARPFRTITGSYLRVNTHFFLRVLRVA